MKEIETFREKITGGEQMVGASIVLNDPMAAELVSRTMDFLWIDMEHGGLSIHDVEKHILLAKKNGKTALVRVPKLDAAWIKMALDAGAHGVIIPQMYSPAEFELCVAYSRYLPEGKRGFGPRIPYEYGKMGSAREYMDWANKNIYVAPQIETKEAYEALDEILKIKGIDALCIGPVDLSISMGYDGDIAHPAMVTVYRDIIGRAKKAGIHAGFGMGISIEYAKKMLGYGVDWIQVGSDFDFINKLANDVFSALKIQPEE